MYSDQVIIIHYIYNTYYIYIFIFSDIFHCPLRGDHVAIIHYIYLYFLVCHCPLREILVTRYSTTVPGTAAATSARAALPIPTSVCGFLCVQAMVWLPAFGIFNVCTQILMHVIAHGSCMDTVRLRLRGSALKIDSGRKINCHTGDSNLDHHCTWLFCQILYQAWELIQKKNWNLPPPPPPGKFAFKTFVTFAFS